MKDGFIKVAAATPEIKVADCVFNSEQILRYIDKAAQEKVKILVFPELSPYGIYLRRFVFTGSAAGVCKG